MPRKEIRMDDGGPRFSKRAKDVVFIKVGLGKSGYGEWNFLSNFDGVSSYGWMCPIENGRPRRKKNNTWVWANSKKLTKEQEQKEFERKKKKILSASSSPAEPIPEGANYCNSCGGNGRSSLDGRKKCSVCRGKGYWTQEDIELYHKDCKLNSCGGGKYSCTVTWERLSREKAKEVAAFRELMFACIRRQLKEDILLKKMKSGKKELSLYAASLGFKISECDADSKECVRVIKPFDSHLDLIMRFRLSEKQISRFIELLKNGG